MSGIFIAIIITLLIVCFVYLILQFEYVTEIKTLSEYMENKTVFFNIDNNRITCIISDIYFSDYFNPRLVLDVIYPSGSKIKLLTTLSEFYNLWEK